MDDRAAEPQHLLDRRRKQPIQVAGQSRALLRITEQGRHAFSDKVPGCIAASVNQQKEEPGKLVRSEPVAIDLRVDERGRNVLGPG